MNGKYHSSFIMTHSVYAVERLKIQSYIKKQVAQLWAGSKTAQSLIPFRLMSIVILKIMQKLLFLGQAIGALGAI